MRWLRVFAIVIVTFALDRLTKSVLMARPLSEGSFVFGKLVGIQRLDNYGLLASTPVPRMLIIIVTSFVILAIAGLIIRKLLERTEDKLLLPLALILGGALGNLYDRVVFGYVFDWMIFFQRSVINIADIAIGAGMIWLLALLRTKKGPETQQDNIVQRPRP